jgi:MFS family permease
MWTWYPAFVAASTRVYGIAAFREIAAIEAFAVIGIAGSLGCVIAGALADRWGRTKITSAALAISGACCILIGFTYGSSPFATLIIGLVWGGSVIADSGQFSAAVSELSTPQDLGTALTLQMATGFLLTFISINVMPFVVAHVGWTWAFWLLAPGPVIGIVAMQTLRRLPAARLIAGGRG